MRPAKPKPSSRPSGSARDPAGASHWLDAGAAHARAGRTAEAIAAYERAARADPDDFRADYSLATLHLKSGRPDLAAPRLECVTQRRPDLFEAQHNLGAALQALERWDGAAEAYSRALALRPAATETRRNLAVILAVLGRVDEAVVHHRQLTDDPASGLWALTRIALLKADAISDVDLARMQSAAADAAVDEETRIGLQFAVAEVLERAGRDEEAFAAFAEGNRRQRAALEAAGVRPAAVLAAHAAAVRQIADQYTEEFLARREGDGLATAAPIFIVGMPRSGSTLIEQILAAHPDVLALGETAILPGLLEAGAIDARTGKAGLRALARRYLDGARARGWAGAGRFVDKTLENYLHVGAIALMFPKAVILHAVRDPVDTCLSCYRQLFASGGETLYDLADIGAEYQLYRRMTDHWRGVLPGRVIDVDHEALVADPEAQTRWLVTEACGLGWDDATLRFHEAAGPVRTASASQVRQPIFRTSLGRWRRYEAHLGPLLAALGPYAPKA